MLTQMLLVPWPFSSDITRLVHITSAGTDALYEGVPRVTGITAGVPLDCRAVYTSES